MAKETEETIRAALKLAGDRVGQLGDRLEATKTPKLPVQKADPLHASDIEGLLGLTRPKTFANAQQSGKLTDALAHYNRSLDKLIDSGMQGKFGDAAFALHKVAKLENGKIVGKLHDNITDQEFESAKKVFDSAKEQLLKTGEGQSAAMEEFTKAKTALGEFTNPVFGKIKALGVKGAFEDNVRGFKVWESGAVKGRGIEIAARAVGLGASLFCGTQAAQSKDGDGNAKSGGERMAWLAAAVGIGAAAALAGGVR